MLREITGKVIDAETGLPIEGAIVLVQWTKTKGFPGMVYHEVEKVVEVVSDKQGKFSIPGDYDLKGNSPEIVVYKQEYVAWRNDFVFPGWKKRTDFRYYDALAIKLEKFKKGFSHDEHHSFMDYGIIGSSLERTPMFNKALSSELREAINETKHKKTY